MPIEVRYELLGVAPTPKRRRGRPPHIPTEDSRSTVSLLALAGYCDEIIASHLDVSLPTLDKYYADELDFALIQANTQVLSAMFENMKKGDLSCIAFGLTHLGGWDDGRQVQQVQKTIVYGPDYDGV